MIKKEGGRRVVEDTALVEEDGIERERKRERVLKNGTCKKGKISTEEEEEETEEE